MNATYEWLYTHYAQELQPDTLQEAEDRLMAQLNERIYLSRENRLFLIDRLADLSFLWGSENFALGIQFGLGLAGDYWNGED